VLRPPRRKLILKLLWSRRNARTTQSHNQNGIKLPRHSRQR
jgi:hypothetical protein